MEDRIKNLEKQIKRVGINHNSIVINSKKIKKIETKPIVEKTREVVIQPQQVDNSRLDLLERKIQKLLDSNRELQNKVDGLQNNKELDAKGIEERFNKRMLNTERVLNSKIVKFQSEILPPVNQLLAHRQMKEKRNKRRG